MENIRTYGSEPYQVAVLHGGPGAPGGAAPLARELSKEFGVLEPLQTADSIQGQILELRDVILKHASVPIILIGHSWGAWLSYLFAAEYPELVRKLILIGSGSFEEEYLTVMKDKRTNRLTEEENKRVMKLMKRISDYNSPDRKESLCEFGKLMSKADSYEPITLEDEVLDFQPEVFQNCMKELNLLRRSKELLEIGRKIKCPVTAIHGEYDSHAYEGVEKPLITVIEKFKFILLKDCGHYPWNEKYAKDKFFEVLYQEIDNM